MAELEFVLGLEPEPGPEAGLEVGLEAASELEVELGPEAESVTEIQVVLVAMV